MKINDSQPIQQTVDSKAAARSTPKADARQFHAILEQTVEQAKPQPGVSRSTGAVNAGAGVVHPVQIRPLTPQDSGQIISRVETMLNTLDDYRRKLADPRFSLKQIAPLVDSIEDQRRHMADALAELGHADALRGIVNETLVTSAVETAKFNRGDYV